MHGAFHPCGLVVLVHRHLLLIAIHKYSKMFEHAQTAHNVRTPMCMLRPNSKHTGVLPGGRPHLWFGVLVCWWCVPAGPHHVSGLMVLWFGVLVSMYVCS